LEPLQYRYAKGFSFNHSGAAEYLKISKPPFLGIDVAPDAYF
jgi:hypothetical protein